MERILLRASEAATVMGFSKSYVHRMILSGEIPSVRFGRAVRIPLDDLNRLIAARVESGDERETA